jgi:hypothetical protein
MPPSAAILERAWEYRRLCWRVMNAFELQSELIVLMCLISDSGDYGEDWLPLDLIEQCVSAKLRELPVSISLVKPVSWYLERAVLARLVQTSRGQYRLTRIGLACVIDHSNRLSRHNAREWVNRWQQQRSEWCHSLSQLDRPPVSGCRD